MPVIGITGGISTGKTSFCHCLRKLVPEAAFFDADRAARELGDKDPEVRALIEAEFGPSAYSAKGGLNREAIRTIRHRWQFQPGPMRVYAIDIRFELQK